MSRNAEKQDYVFLIYEHKDRELKSCMKIKEVLEKKYNIQALIFSQPFEVTDTVRAYIKHHPKAVIVPWGYTDHFVREFSPLFTSNKCPYVISLDCEQVYSEFNKLRYTPSNEYCKHRIIHCAWGENFAKLLTDNGADAANVYITGNSRVDIILEKRKENKEIERHKLALEFGLDVKKKWLLFAESRAMSYSEDTISKYEQYGIPAEENRKRLQRYTSSLKEFLKNLQTINECFFDEYEFIYRAHPGQDISDEINHKIKSITQFSIYDWFPAIDILVSFNSSALLEAQAFGVPVIRYKDDTDSQYLCLGIEKLPYINSFNDLIGFKVEDFHTKEIYENYLGLADGESVNRISDLIFKVVRGEIKPFDRNVNKRFLTFLTMRRLIAESIFRARVFFYGLEGLRGFPSYKMRRDLPESYHIKSKRPSKRRSMED